MTGLLRLGETHSQDEHELGRTRMSGISQGF